MSWNSVIPLTLLLISSVSAQTSSVLVFNQCECRDNLFGSTGNFLSNAEPSQGVNSFGCIGLDATGFPSEAGITFETDPTTNPLRASVEPEVFFSGEDRVTTFFHGQVSFNAAADFSSIIFVASTYSFSLILASGQLFTQFFDGVSSVTPNGIAVSGATEVTFCMGDLSVGQVQNSIFACIDLGSGFVCQEVNSINGGNVGDNVNLDLFTTNSAAAETVIRSNFIEIGNDLIPSGSNLAAAQAACTALPTPSVDTIPNVDVLAFTTDEDVDVDLDLEGRLVGGDINANNLDFTIDQGDLSGVFNPALADNLGLFNYDPDLNTNGEQEFTFTYSTQVGASLECSNSAVFKLDITPVNDPPEVNDQTFGVFATVPAEFRDIVIATDVDGVNGELAAGAFRINSLPAGIFTNCDDDDPLDETSVLDITDGLVSICYTPDVTIVNPGEVLEFTVSDLDQDNEGTASGTITFNGDNPIQVINPTLDAQEDIQRNIQISQLGNGENNLDFNVRITALPNANDGTLTLVDETPIVIGQNAEFTEDDTIVFLGAEDKFGDVTFQYEVFRDFGEDQLTDEGGVVTLEIAARDDGGATIEAGDEQETGIEVRDGDVVEGIEVTIVSDNGDNQFDVELQIQAIAGMRFEIQNSNGLSLANEVDGDDNNADCTAGGCTSVIITASPNRLERAVRELEITPPALDADFLAVTFTVRADGEDFIDIAPGQVEIDFSVNNDPLGFFEQDQNIYIVSGVGLLAVVLISVFFIHRSTQAKAIGETNILAIAAGNVDKELRAKKKQEKRERRERQRKAEAEAANSSRSAASPKGGADEGDDDIFDWEKHIDEKTKETYFFNPKTGESRWDPPTKKAI